MSKSKYDPADEFCFSGMAAGLLFLAPLCAWLAITEHSKAKFAEPKPVVLIPMEKAADYCERDDWGCILGNAYYAGWRPK